METKSIKVGMGTLQLMNVEIEDLKKRVAKLEKKGKESVDAVICKRKEN
jgi:FtsZ-binding cell division protein ZapB